MNRWNLLFLFFFLNSNLIAQRFEIGYEIGYGKIGLFYPYSKATGLSFIEEDYSSLRMGLLSYYIPDSSYISIKTGLCYNQIYKNNTWEAISNIKILQLPLDIDFRIGKKKHLLLGGGCYFNYLINSKITDTRFPNFQIGLNANLGLVYVIKKRFCIDLECRYGYDLTKLYTTTEYSHFGGPYFKDTYSTNLNLLLTLRYKINKN